MLPFSLALARRVSLSSVIQKRCASASAASASSTATPAAQKASHILSLTGPLKDSEPSLLYQQQQYLKLLGNSPKPEELEVAFKVYEKVLDLSRGVDKFACARLSLLCLNHGMPDRALEPWARLLEALATRVRTPKALENILDKPDFEPAALAALVAYFVVAGPAADPETAKRLVPRQQIPSNLSILNNLGGIKSQDAKQVAVRGLASLRKHVTQGFTSPKFIEQVQTAPFAEAHKLWDQVTLATLPGEIPEVCFAAFIRRFAENRESQRAFDLWQELNRSGVKITTCGWKALLRAVLCAPKNSEELFVNIWDKMVANGFKPDAGCITERLLYLTRYRTIEETLAEFNEIQSKHPELLELPGVNIILTALGKKQMFEEANRILEWARESGLKPNEYTYNAIISASARKPELASKYLQEMIESGIKPTVVTYTFAMQQLLKRGQSISELVKEMKQANIEPNEVFNTTLAYYSGKSTRNLSPSREIMKSALDNRLRLNIQTLGAFVQLELEYGEVERAAQYTQLMHKFGLTPNLPTYNQLIRGALKRKNFDIARSTFHAMVNGPVQRLRPNNYTYSFILSPWNFADLQSNASVRSLVREVVSVLAQQPSIIDFRLAERIKAISSATGSDLVPEGLLETASQISLQQYDRRMAPKN